MAMDSFGIVGHAYRDGECLDATMMIGIATICRGRWIRILFLKK